jgi:DNA-binding winged helix-turn-helix (wHTH) protein
MSMPVVHDVLTTANTYVHDVLTTLRVHDVLTIDTYELDAHRGELRCANHPVALEPKVFDVLVYLLEHRDRIVTQDDLLEHCWAGRL